MLFHKEVKLWMCWGTQGYQFLDLPLWVMLKWNEMNLKCCFGWAPDELFQTTGPAKTFQGCQMFSLSWAKTPKKQWSPSMPQRSSTFLWGIYLLDCPLLFFLTIINPRITWIASIIDPRIHHQQSVCSWCFLMLLSLLQVLSLQGDADPILKPQTFCCWRRWWYFNG